MDQKNMMIEVPSNQDIFVICCPIIVRVLQTKINLLISFNH